MLVEVAHVEVGAEPHVAVILGLQSVGGDRALAREDLLSQRDVEGQRPEQFRLAISIHAPSDALRRSLMPINVKYPLDDVVKAAADFDRRVTFEYVMLGGVNDAPQHADMLAALARRCGAFVNLIPLHPGGAGDFTPTTAAGIRAFAAQLKRHQVEVAIRKSRGKDIAAACGQLRVERLRRRAHHTADQHGDVDVA